MFSLWSSQESIKTTLFLKTQLEFANLRKFKSLFPIELTLHYWRQKSPSNRMLSKAKSGTNRPRVTQDLVLSKVNDARITYKVRDCELVDWDTRCDIMGNVVGTHREWGRRQLQCGEEVVEADGEGRWRRESMRKDLGLFRGLDIFACK